MLQEKRGSILFTGEFKTLLKLVKKREEEEASRDFVYSNYEQLDSNSVKEIISHHHI